MKYKYYWLICSFLCLATTAIAQTQKQFKLHNQTIELVTTDANFEIEITIEEPSEQLGLATLKLTSTTAKVPSPLSIKWSLPSSNIAGYWSTQAFLNKTIAPNWGPSTVRSVISRHAPVITLFGHDQINQQTFSVDEIRDLVICSTSIKEENGKVYNEVQLFTEATEAKTSYEFQFRLDQRPLHYAQSLQGVGNWWQSKFPAAPAPKSAGDAVYSTWYSYHQNLQTDALLTTCSLASKMGYKTLIIDDGWQTLDGNRGYAYTGDWEPERLQDIGRLVDSVHKMHMKVMLWYAVPFVGEKSKAYLKMKDKVLRYWDGQGAYIMDPRYPEVRSHIIQTYTSALKKWNLDGFKLDFIGRFRADKNIVLTAENGRDIASVSQATDVLMKSLLLALRAINPEVLVEFRQPYTGPSMLQYGNMMRASDCPNVALLNRVQTTDLKLLSQHTYVHADMLMWHYNEPVEQAALQFLNVLFAVPQMSVRLYDIPSDHFKMVQFYTEYWVKNSDILLKGAFTPGNPLLNYPILKAEKDNKVITAVYNEQIVSLDNTVQAFDIINATNSKQLVLAIEGLEKPYKMQVFDCTGTLVKEQQTTLKTEVRSIEVPPSGIIKLTPIQL